MMLSLLEIIRNEFINLKFFFSKLEDIYRMISDLIFINIKKKILEMKDLIW